MATDSRQDQALRDFASHLFGRTEPDTTDTASTPLHVPQEGTTTTRPTDPDRELRQFAADLFGSPINHATD